MGGDVREEGDERCGGGSESGSLTEVGGGGDGERDEDGLEERWEVVGAGVEEDGGPEA